MTVKPVIRCAIYTRKSSEEGLEQAFNSLDAQQEACTAYIVSQRHEGWKQLPERYDDGGISGGTLERPALQRLLADIDAGRVTMVVVYKIDRLTRDLADFAKIVERFDAAGCSFVSVTQAFNTSTSMGRLTLNVLLSFAQFEREVTAERIRDKIAASKKKGLWMGGIVPLGYDADPDPNVRGLVVNRPEAENVTTLFELYDQLDCLRRVEDEAKRRRIRSKLHLFASGKSRGDVDLTRGMIHYLLTNPIYLGQIRHKKHLWPGQQAAIVSQDLWDRVQAKLQLGSARKRGVPTAVDGAAKTDNSSPLVGKIRDETGDRLTPSHTARHGRRLRYYVSNRLLTGKTTVGLAEPNGRGWRLPAQAFEQAVAKVIADHLGTAAAGQYVLYAPDAATASRIAVSVTSLAERLRQDDKATLRALVSNAQIKNGAITIILDPAELAAAIGVLTTELKPELSIVSGPFALRRRGIEAKIIAGSQVPASDPTLVRLLTKAHRWVLALENGTQLAEIANRDGHSDSYVRTRIALAFLSPRIQAAILDGNQPPDMSVARILHIGIPLDWSEQERAFGLSR
ncbi:MAG: recombinase family protein [Cypionkella sp.]|uniref:recombinase family protein n=1 Tax=Cypionkella sp. TaxID=2811411 RepID=UPI00260C7452|nr:recombinase family protein [Cypionkella sp.]MDB5660456.1 recombinase family protein [Cypionkella sp.]